MVLLKPSIPLLPLNYRHTFNNLQIVSSYATHTCSVTFFPTDYYSLTIIIITILAHVTAMVGVVQVFIQVSEHTMHNTDAVVIFLTGHHCFCLHSTYIIIT